MEFSDQIQSVALSLSMVIGLMLLLAYGVRTLRGRVNIGQGDLEVLSATAVGPKERLLLVRVRDREVLLGIGPQHISSLAEFPAASKAGDQHQNGDEAR